MKIFYIFSVFNPTTVVLSIAGEGFLSKIAAIEAAAKTTTQAITIPAMAPPLKPPELFEKILEPLEVGLISVSFALSILIVSKSPFESPDEQSNCAGVVVIMSPEVLT